MVYLVYLALLSYLAGPGWSKSVYLANRELTEVPSTGIVWDTEKLFLGNNNLTSVASEDFEGLSLLEELYLSQNFLTVFPNLTSVSRSLRLLHITDNFLNVIPEGHLAVLYQLRYLFLKNNQLTSVPDVAVSSMQLLTFNLQGNHMTSFPVWEILGRTLTRLMVSENAIKDINADHFQGLAKLEDLNLSDNLLESFPNFTHIKDTLEILNLSGNAILTIPIEYATGFENLQEINLENNKLETVPILGVSTKIFLAGNPLHCDSGLSWVIDREGIEGVCSEPDRLAGRDLATLNLTDIGNSEGE